MLSSDDCITAEEEVMSVRTFPSLSGQELAALRREAGMTQTQLARLARIGRHAASYWEQKPSVTIWMWAPRRMLEVLGIKVVPYNDTSTRPCAPACHGVLHPMVLKVAEVSARATKPMPARRQPRQPPQRVPCGAKTRRGEPCRMRSEPGQTPVQVSRGHVDGAEDLRRTSQDRRGATQSVGTVAGSRGADRVRNPCLRRQLVVSSRGEHGVGALRFGVSAPEPWEEIMPMTMRTCLSTLAVALMVLPRGMAAAQDADIQAQLEDLQQQYEEALAAGNLEAIGAMFAEDATYMPFIGGMAEGRDSIQSMHEQTPVQSIDVRSTKTEMIGDDVVLDVGTWTATLPEEAGDGTIEGEYILVAEVTDNGLVGRSLTSFLTRQPPAPAQQ